MGGICEVEFATPVVPAQEGEEQKSVWVVRIGEHFVELLWVDRTQRPTPNQFSPCWVLPHQYLQRFTISE